MPQKIILDCDPGIDDALAILLALASPEIELVGVTTVAGNTHIENETRNALALLALGAAPHVPVAQGCPRPLIKTLHSAEDTHGDTGLGYAKLPVPVTQPIQKHAVDFLIDQVMSQPNELALVAIGPLTNIALALRKEPRIAQAVQQCIIMGGAIRHHGNMPMKAEFNTWVDPHAAHIVYHSGLPITLVPLDVTYDCLFTPQHTQRLLAVVDCPATRFVDDATKFYMEFHDTAQNISGCAINDPLALALVFAPNLVRTQHLFVDVELAGSIAQAGTFADFFHLTPNPPNMHVALEVDAPQFLDLFIERVGRWAKTLPQL